MGIPRISHKNWSTNLTWSEVRFWSLSFLYAFILHTRLEYGRIMLWHCPSVWIYLIVFSTDFELSIWNLAIGLNWPTAKSSSSSRDKSRFLQNLSFRNCGVSFCTFYVFSCDQAALQMVFSVRLSVRPSVCLSVCLSHLFHHVPIIVSSWYFQELLPWSKVMSMQKVKVRGQRSRSQRSIPNLAVSGL